MPLDIHLCSVAMCFVLQVWRLAVVTRYGVCVCVCAHTHTCIHTCVCVRAYTHAHAHVCVCVMCLGPLCWTFFDSSCSIPGTPFTDNEILVALRMG